MADFFSRLIERHRGSADVVQPIQPSRYASAVFEWHGDWTTTPSLDGDEFKENAGIQDRSNLQTEASAARSPVSPETQSASKASLNVDISSREMDLREFKRERRARPGLKPCAEAVPNLREREEKSATNHVVPSRNELPLPLKRKAPDEQKKRPFAEENFQGETVVEPRCKFERAISPQPLVSAAVVPAGDPDRKEEQLPLRPLRVQAVPRRPIQPELPAVKKPEAQSRPSIREPVPETSPAVKVHIGRIEVRAVMSVPPSRKETPKALPMLSLEDYLNRRERP